MKWVDSPVAIVTDAEFLCNIFCHSQQLDIFSPTNSMYLSYGEAKEEDLDVFEGTVLAETCVVID